MTEDTLEIVLPQLRFVLVRVKAQSLTIEIPQIRVVKGALID